MVKRRMMAIKFVTDASVSHRRKEKGAAAHGPQKPRYSDLRTNTNPTTANAPSSVAAGSGTAEDGGDADHG